MWSCTWSNKRVKSCYCVRSRLSTDQGNLSRGQPVLAARSIQSCGAGGSQMRPAPTLSYTAGQKMRCTRQCRRAAARIIDGKCDRAACVLSWVEILVLYGSTYLYL